MITAHGGAQKTGRNSKAYFDAIERGEISADAIEVDVRSRKGKLFISHLPPIFSKSRIPLEFVFEFAVKHNLLVNFDIKNKSSFVPVRDMAINLKAEKHLLYTGETKPEHIEFLTCGQVYANGSFFANAGLSFVAADVEEIKKYLDSFNNEGLKGINVNYRKINDAFLAECKRVGLGVSLYTVDTEEALKKYLPLNLDNVTTNRPDLAKQTLEGKNA